MAERNPCRPWTEQEDALLREGVATYGEQDHWKDIALTIPGRTNKACRKRWLHSLSPTVRKCAWSQDEDNLLLSLFKEHGSKWSLIARSISGRTDDACSKRYREALDPSLKKDEWTPEEDEKLLEAYTRNPNKWIPVAQELGRSSLGCRNRWRLLERKRTARATQEASSSQNVGPGISLHAAGSQGLSSQHSPSSTTVEAHDTIWPPYYPPEMYPTLPDGDIRSVEFREPTPEVASVSPYVAPFQPSSSSLSTALSAPPPRPRPLPPDNSFPTLINHSNLLSHSHSQPASQSTSPLFFGIQIIPSNDVTMSLGDYGMDTEHHPSNIRTDIPQTFIGQGASPLPLTFPLFQDPGMCNTVSPISPSVLALPVDPLQFGDQWKSPHFSSLFSTGLQDYSPSLLQHSVSSTSEPLPLDELSSAATTPFPISASISPTTPNSDLQTDLPNLADISSMGVSPTGGSLLFSVPSPQPQAPTRRRRKTIKRHKPEAIIRLSSNLKLSADPNVRPYVCGHNDCWPNYEEKSRACFATSKDLFDHNRDVHPEETNCDKPFRCGLEGCGKSWKSINGLQYHLQISAAHFKNALQSRFSAQQSSLASPISDDVFHNSSGKDLEDDEADRRYTCPQPNCFKAYRQPSGLRYHLKHGHPSEMPIQLPEVPPALERELPKKAKKMRLKSPEPS